MRPWISIGRIATALALALGGGGHAGAVTEPPPDPVRLGLYEWMAVVPTVVAGEIIGDDGKLVVAVATTPIKGDIGKGAAIKIDLREANRDRDPGTPALDLVKGKSYLLLLKPSSRAKPQQGPVFTLERGVRGAKELPAEGSAATVDAMLKLAAVQERQSDSLLWATLPEFLDDPNPVLVDAALDLYVKFRREGANLIPVLAPLLDHPRPDFRRRAALLLGRVLRRAGATAIVERPETVAALTGRARRDEDATVRREATVALAALADPGIDETLGKIAQDDPDQDVRFEAVKALSERKQTSGAKRSD